MKPTSTFKISGNSEGSNNNSNNKYIMLLQRLNEDEGLCEPSIEEKLKLAEDHLRLSCAKFCDAASTLLEENKKVKTKKSVIFDPETIQQLFQANSLKPSFRPPKTELRSLSEDSRKMESSVKSSVNEMNRDRSGARKRKQAYYTPPSSWFSTERSTTDLSSEEVELLSSCATKAFVRFLDEKKKEIPRIFSVKTPNSEAMSTSRSTIMPPEKKSSPRLGRSLTK